MRLEEVPDDVCRVDRAIRIAEQTAGGAGPGMTHPADRVPDSVHVVLACCRRDGHRSDSAGGPHRRLRAAECVPELRQIRLQHHINRVVLSRECDHGDARREYAWQLATAERM